MRSVDVAVVGAGTAGLAAYRAARAHTDRVLLLNGGPYGTTCARVGCMPSKLLIAAADAHHHVDLAPKFGVHVDGSIRVDGRKVMDRVKSERDRFVGFVLESVEDIPAEHRKVGYAHFESPHRLRVDDGTEVEADRIVIASGSRPTVPPMLEPAKDRILVNDDVFDLDAVPESAAVFGGGVIGLELAQALHRLGCRVRLFGRDGRVGPLTDPVVQSEARAIFEGNMPFHSDIKVERVARDGDHVAVTFELDGQTTTEHFDVILAATGRRPNLDLIKVENAGVDLDDRGIPRFDPFTMQCGESHVFIAGDVDHQLPLLHEAADEGKIAGDNAGRFPDVRCGLRRSPLSIVFTDPNIAMVGRTHRELAADIESGRVVTGEIRFEDQGRSRVMLMNEGILRVYARQGTGEFLGAEMVGPRMEHVAHLLAWSHQAKLTVPAMVDMPFYHPVIEEGLRTALRMTAKSLKMGLRPPPNCLDLGPGG
ncbi:MAG: dihydrolipoyl dehydrogenase [Myxococcota bacterium]